MLLYWTIHHNWNISFYTLYIFALSCIVCLLRLNLVPEATILYSNCSSLNQKRTSSSKTLPSVCRRFQREPPLKSSWEMNTSLPWALSEFAATLLQVRTTEGLIKLSTYTSLHDTFNNVYFSSQQIWKNPARSIPVNKKASDDHRARGASFSLSWFKNLHNIFFTSSKTCFMHFFTDLVVDLINVQVTNSPKSTNQPYRVNLETFENITLSVLYICMSKFSPNKAFINTVSSCFSLCRHLFKYFGRFVVKRMNNWKLNRNGMR